MFVVLVRIALVLVLSFGVDPLLAHSFLYLTVSAPGLVLAYLSFGSLAFMLGGLLLVLVSPMQLALTYSSFGSLEFVLVARLFLYLVVSVMGQALARSLYR